MIKVKIINPPLGISENQEFENVAQIEGFLASNKERLPFARYEYGTITYGHEIYEQKDGLEVLVDLALKHKPEILHDEPTTGTFREYGAQKQEKAPWTWKAGWNKVRTKLGF